MRSNSIAPYFADRDRCLIVDMDGTLAFKGDRDPHDLSTVDKDEPNFMVVQSVKTYWRDGWNYVVMSGRQETARKATATWLKRHGLWYASGLIMRSDKDNRPDEVVKRELFETYIKPRWDEFLVLDDRDKVVRMWREELHLTCFQVNYGDF